MVHSVPSLRPGLLNVQEVSYIVLSPRDATVNRTIPKLPQNLWIDNGNQINYFLNIISIKVKFLSTVYEYYHDLFPIIPQPLWSGQVSSDHRQAYFQSFWICDVTTLGSIIMGIWHFPGSTPHQTDTLATSQCPCPHFSLDSLSLRKPHDLCPGFISMAGNAPLPRRNNKEF